MKKLIFIGIILIQTLTMFCQVKVWSGGNIGFGTTGTVSQRFQFVGASGGTNSILFVKPDNWSSGSYGELMFGDGSHYIKGEHTNGMSFYDANKFSFSGSYVGIGDATPVALLTVGNGDLFQVSTTGHTRTIDGTVGSPAFSFTGAANMGMYKSGANQLSFATGGTERVHIHSDGNVGIGASVPSQKLEINGNAIINGSDKRLYFVTAPNRYVGMANSSDLGLINKEATWLRISSGSGIAFFSNHLSPETSSTGFKMMIDGNGVGIGGYAYNPYPLVVYGSALAYGGTWQASDVQYKEDITAITSPLTILNQISGKKYKYKTSEFPELNFPLGYTYGVLAQEVQTVLPELVQAGLSGYLAVNYEGLIPVLIEALKEQQKQITQLQNDLTICCLNSNSNPKSLNNDNNSGNEPQGNTQNTETKQSIQEKPKLYQNTPNPFNSKTEIKYYLPEKTINATILIFDMQGALLRTHNLMNTGNGSLEIFGGELKSGMYMYSLILDGKEIDTKKMILTD